MFWLSSFLVRLLLSSSVDVITPRVFIVNFFQLKPLNGTIFPSSILLAQNITVPGLSPLYPDLITGQAEINAASTMSSLLNSRRFDLRSTYWLISGIAGVNPKHATIGGVTFSRYAMPPDFPSGYFAQGTPRSLPTDFGTTAPGQYPNWIVNDALRQVAVDLAKTAQLTDTEACKRLRATYTSPIFAAGAAPPSIVMCDTLTSDTFWTGAYLAEAFENTTLLLTHQKGVYCSTQQEDNAVLSALLRGALSNLVDFSRIIVMRSGSDFDRPPENLFALTVGFPPALLNLRIAGVKIVQGIVDGWATTFKRGIEPANDIGDILGSLGGKRHSSPPGLFGRRLRRG
ncbi:purine nucleoside permease [Mycena filopes]|nr:purine nucleoside permease [Mycena filopes]